MTNWQNDTLSIWRSTTHVFDHTLDPRTFTATTPSTSVGAGSAASWATRTPKTGPPSSSSGCCRWPPTSPSGASLSTWPSIRPLRTLWQKKTGGSICRSGQCSLTNRTNRLERYVTTDQKGLPVTNTLACWAHSWVKKKMKWYKL